MFAPWIIRELVWFGVFYGVFDHFSGVLHTFAQVAWVARVHTITKLAGLRRCCGAWMGGGTGVLLLWLYLACGYATAATRPKQPHFSVRSKTSYG